MTAPRIRLVLRQNHSGKKTHLEHYVETKLSNDRRTVINSGYDMRKLPARAEFFKVQETRAGHRGQRRPTLNESRGPELSTSKLSAAAPAFTPRPGGVTTSPQVWLDPKRQNDTKTTTTRYIQRLKVSNDQSSAAVASSNQNSQLNQIVRYNNEAELEEQMRLAREKETARCTCLACQATSAVTGVEAIVLFDAKESDQDKSVPSSIQRSEFSTTGTAEVVENSDPWVEEDNRNAAVEYSTTADEEGVIYTNQNVPRSRYSNPQVEVFDFDVKTPAFNRSGQGVPNNESHAKAGVFDSSQTAGTIVEPRVQPEILPAEPSANVQQITMSPLWLEHHAEAASALVPTPIRLKDYAKMPHFELPFTFPIFASAIASSANVQHPLASGGNQHTSETSSASETSTPMDAFLSARDAKLFVPISPHH